MKPLLSSTRIALAIITILAPFSITYAQNKAAKIDELVQQYVANRQFNGSVLVAEKGQVIIKKGYGMANMEWNIPNAPDTKFRLGSITKQFTAMLVMQLVEKDKLKLDGKITDYLPDYPKATGDKITIHQLLTHTSGIPNYTNFPQFTEKTSRNPYKPAIFINEFSSLPLDFEPGSKYSYSNSGYFLLGVLIEKVTGKSYADVLQENILTPLQLKDTGYDLFGPIIAKRATGYQKMGSGFENAPYLDMTIPYAAGSLYSTVEDLYRWDQALYTDKLLTSKSKATMYTPFLDGYAYGWSVRNQKIGELSDSLQVIEHSGGINGFQTIISRIPKDKQLVILLNNTGGAPLGAMRKNIINILYNQPVEPPKKSVADALRKLVLTEPIDKLRGQFNALKTNKEYRLDESEMDALGYDLLRSGRMQPAISVLTLNVESFPNSDNVYDSRGEAYMTAGDKEAAIRDYKKSVELNPHNVNGVDQLKKLGETVAPPKDVVVDTIVLESYVGNYQLAPSFSIAVTRDGNQLYGQATGQPRFELFPASKTKFYLKVVDAEVSFVANDKGEIDQLILHQNGQNMPGKRVR